MNEGTKVDAAIDELRAQVAELKAQLRETQQRLEKIQPARAAQPIAARLFLTLSAAGAALGLGKAQVRELIERGALRTVQFPNGTCRVPRSEIDRIDALGLEIELSRQPPARARAEAVEAVDDSPVQPPIPRAVAAR